MSDWAEGRIDLGEHTASVAEARLYKEIAALSYEDIEHFYQPNAT